MFANLISSLTGHQNDSYLDRMYETLFHPIRAFDEIADLATQHNKLFLESLLTVIVISAMAPILFTTSHGNNPDTLAYEIPIQAVLGVGTWLVIAFLFSMISYAFTEVSRFRVLLILSGFATLPWLLMAPLTLIKIALGITGETIHLFAGLVIWLWSTLLFAVALMKTYKLSADRVLIVLLVPLLMTVVSTAWLSGFVVNLVRLMPEG